VFYPDPYKHWRKNEDFGGDCQMRAENRGRSRGWVLGKGAASFLFTCYGAVSSESSPSGVRDGASTAERFSTISALRMASPDTILS